MSINQALAQVSGDFLIAALVIYSLAVLAFAGDFAFGRPSRAAGAARDTAEAWFTDTRLTLPFLTDCWAHPNPRPAR